VTRPAAVRVKMTPQAAPTAEGHHIVRILKSIALLACATAVAAALGRYGVRVGGEGRNFAW